MWAVSSVVDTFVIIACFLQLLPVMALTATKYITVGTERKGSLRSVLLQVAASHVSNRLELRQLLVVSPNVPLDSLMSKLKHELKHLKNYGTPFPFVYNTAKSFWLVQVQNRKPEDPVLVFFHGGGYVISAMKEHLRFLNKLYNRVGNSRLSILMLDYTLAPDAEYPEQLREAYALYRQLTVNGKCCNIVLAGDSAGGNLAIVLMAHLHYGNSLLKDMDEHSTMTAVQLVKPSGAILLSPWVDLAAKKEGTYKSNERSDYVSFETDLYMSCLYCPNTESAISPWVSPVYAEPEFWKGVLPENLLIVCGGGETALDRIISWAQNAGVRKKMYVEPKGIHVSAIFDFEKHYKRNENVATTKIIEFCKASLEW